MNIELGREDIKAGCGSGGLCLRGLKAIITMDPSKPIINDGYIYVEEGEIKDVGEGKGPSAELEIDCHGLLAMPGMIDLHSHSTQAFLRGIFNEKCLMDWLNATKKAYSRTNKEILEISSKISMLERLKGGITFVVDMEPSPELVAKASISVGIRAEISVLMADVPELPDQEVMSLESELNKARGAIDEFHGKGRLRVSLAPVGFPAVSKELLERSGELARQRGLRLHTHVGESNVNANLCKRRYGVSEVELLEDSGFLGPRTQIVHAVWISRTDIETLSKYRTSVVHCPTSNLTLAAGIARIPQMIKMGVRVGLGLDGAASNPSQDMFQEMRLASILHKGFLQDPKVVSSEKSLRMATTEAANILGLEDKLGMISDGYWADIVLINISRAGYLPYEAITHHLVHSAQPSDVFGVTVGGELLIWNGVHKGLDEVNLLNEAKNMFSVFLQGIRS